MTDSSATQSSTEFIDFWNEIMVPKFMAYRHVLVEGLERHSAEIFPKLAVQKGDNILDVGCGFGDTAILLANIAGNSGKTVGIDCCEAFLDEARKDAAAQGVDNVSFQIGDAQSYPFNGEYDFCFSRFGTQFFENPVAGLRNIRKALRPGGQFAMIVWRDIEDNPWLGMPRDVVYRYLPKPGEDARSCGPGPFSMADPELVRTQMRIAGFADVVLHRIDVPLQVGNDLDDAIAFQMNLGPAGEVVREAGALAAERRDEIEAALREALSDFVQPEGVIMQSSSWLVEAVNPL